MKDSGYKILLCGVVIMAFTFSWFLSTTGGRAGDNSFHCLYSNPFDCQIAWTFLEAMGKTTYSYLSFWFGIVVTAVGVILMICGSEKEAQCSR